MDRSYGGWITLTKLKGSINGFCMCSIKHRYVTWVTRIKAVLCNNGFAKVWLFGCGQEGPFFKELKERLYNSFCHGWLNHMESSTWFSIYRQFKYCFEREYYVDVIWINIYRNALGAI